MKDDLIKRAKNLSEKGNVSDPLFSKDEIGEIQDKAFSDEQLRLAKAIKNSAGSLQLRKGLDSVQVVKELRGGELPNMSLEDVVMSMSQDELDSLKKIIQRAETTPQIIVQGAINFNELPSATGAYEFLQHESSYDDEYKDYI